MAPVIPSEQVPPPHGDLANVISPMAVGQVRPSPQAKAIVQATRAAAYRQAAAVLLYVARNSVIAVAAAWCANWVMTLGNVFSSAAPADQSLQSFTLAIVVWTVILDAIAAGGLQGASLFLAQMLISSTTKRFHLLWCIGVLLWRTSHWLVVMGAVSVAATYAICAGGPSVCKWKPYFYVTAVACHVYRTRIIQEARRILKSLRSNYEGQAPHHAVVLDYSWRRLLPKNLAILFAVYIATGYVQATTELNLESPAWVCAFFFASLVVKFVLQELAIHRAMRRKRIRIEQMHAMIAVPTVLVGMQVRIVILRAAQLSNDGIASTSRGSSMIHLRWSGSLLLAVFKILVRVSRTWWFHRKIRHRQQTWNRPTRRMISVALNSVQPFPSVAVDSPWTPETEFQQWKSRRVSLHAAEVQADMHAEYIAIGCSLSVYHFCRGHAKFEIAETPSISPSSVPYAEVVVFQVGVELLADLLCTTIEIASGICFQVPRSTDAFLVVLYISCALGNIIISMTMLLVSGSE